MDEGKCLLNKRDSDIRPCGTDMFFVLMLICISGNQAFTTGSGNRQEIVLLLLFAAVFARMTLQKRVLINRVFVAVILAYMGIFFLQSQEFVYFSAFSAAGFFVKLAIAAGVVGTVRHFRLVFVRVMVGLAVLSLVFHIPTLLAGIAGIRVYEVFRPLANVVGAAPPGVTERVNILFHNFVSGDSLFRNSGIFWEPGAFSGYLVLALLMLATLQQVVPKPTLRRWRAVLAVTALTTLSTTGFLLLPFALFAFKLVKLDMEASFSRRILWVLLFALLLLPIALYMAQLDFIGPKITALYNRALHKDPGWQLSRFGAMIFDGTYIEQRPLFGWGQSTGYLDLLFPRLDRFDGGNGLTTYIRKMGFAGMMVFLWSFWYGLGRIGMSGLSRGLIFAIPLMQLNGELFLDYPLYLALHFLALERCPKLECPPQPVTGPPGFHNAYYFSGRLGSA